MGTFSVLILAPGGQRDAGIVRRREQGFIQQVTLETTVEAFDESILGRLPGCDFGHSQFGERRRISMAMLLRKQSLMFIEIFTSSIGHGLQHIAKLKYGCRAKY